MDWIEPHKGEKPRRAVEFANRAEGWVLAAVSLLAITERVMPAEGWIVGIRPAVAASAGLLLPVLILLHAGSKAAREVTQAVRSLPAYWMHLVAAAALLAGGAGELLSPALPPFAGVWPLACIVWGSVFVLQRQHGVELDVARSMTRHRAVGAALIAAGALRGIAVVLVPVVNPAWAVATMVAGLLLVSYKEPQGAFKGSRLTTHYHYE